MAQGRQSTAPRAGRVAAVVALACLAAAPTAHAAEGDGPYTPFPDDANGRAGAFVNKLDKRPGSSGGAPSARPRISPDELAKGAYLPQGPEGPRQVGTRSRRADSGSGSGVGQGADSGAGSGIGGQGAARSNPFDRAGPGVAARAGRSGRPDVPSSLPFLAAGLLLALGAAGAAFAPRRRARSG